MPNSSQGSVVTRKTVFRSQHVDVVYCYTCCTFMVCVFVCVSVSVSVTVVSPVNTDESVKLLFMGADSRGGAQAMEMCGYSNVGCDYHYCSNLLEQAGHHTSKIVVAHCLTHSDPWSIFSPACIK